MAKKESKTKEDAKKKETTKQNTKPKAKAASSKEVKTKPKAKAKETKVEEVKAEAKETKSEPAQEEKKFVAFCGGKFNPSPESTCFLMCKKENSNDFEMCLANFEEMKTKPVTKRLRRRNIDYFGDGIGTSASMINEMLVCGATMEEIQEEVQCKASRIRGHFGGLRSQGIKTRVKKFEIFKNKENDRYYFDEPDLPYYGDMDEEGCPPRTTSIKSKRKSK